MKNTLRRIFCLLLCAVMMAAILPAGASAETRLATPADVSWSPTIPGGVYWRIEPPVESPKATYRVDIYKDNELVHTQMVVEDSTSPYSAANLSFEYTLTDGEYDVSVTAIATQEGYEDSGTVLIGGWKYKHPGKNMSSPTGLRWEGTKANWDTKYSGAEFGVKLYYSATKSGTPKEIKHLNWYEAGVDLAQYMEKPGYYAFKVRTFSLDVTEKYHSAWTAMSDASYFDPRVQLGDPSYVYWAPATPGNVLWCVNNPIEHPEAHFRVDLYKDNTKVYSREAYGFMGEYYDDSEPVTFDVSLTDGDYEFTTGKYYATVTAIAKQEGYQDSNSIKSDVWEYTRPSSRYSRPTNLKWNYPTVSWDSNYSKGDFEVQVYYSATKAGIPGEYLCGHVISGAKSYNMREIVETNGKGYYSVRVRVPTRDITQKYHSAWSAFTDAYYYDTTIQLGAPSDITWSEPMPGGVYWTMNEPVEGLETYYQVNLYKDGKKIDSHEVWGFSGELENYSYCETSYDELETGKYYVTVKAVAKKEGFKDSKTVKSDVWNYTKPSSRYSRPTKLTWDYPLVKWSSNYSDATYQIKVYYSATKDGTPKEIPWNTSTTEKELDIRDFVCDYGKGYYYFKVRTYSWDITKKCHSAWTDLSEAYYCDGRLLAASTLKVSTDEATGCPKLTWNKVTAAEKYRLYRADSKNGTYKVVKTTKASSSFLDTTAEPGKTYYYKVRAICEDPFTGEDSYSAYSNVVSSLCDLAKPEITVTVTKNGDPKISWEAVDGAAKYYVYRSTSKSSGFKHIKSTITALSYTDTTANAGTKYYYKVKAVHSNTDANSAYSAVKYATAK